MNRRHFLQLSLALASTLSLRAQPRPSLSWVQWSDVHWGNQQFDPAAWTEALERGASQPAQALLFTGDQGDNGKGSGDFSERLMGFWKPTLDYLKRDSRPWMLTLGNSDFRHNYQTDPETLRETAGLYQELLGWRYYLDELGNGKHPSTVSGWSWVSLNTQIFSPKNRYPGAEAQARKSLDWLKEVLAKTSTPTMLLLHIPPLWDLFSESYAWRPEWIRAFQSVLEQSPQPLMILGGHFHRNEIHGIRRAFGEVPILVGGSLSRKYDYAPNWRTCEFSFDQGCRSHLSYTGHSHSDTHYQWKWQQLSEVERALADPLFLAQYVGDLFARHPQAVTHPERYRAEILEHFWAALPAAVS